MSILIDTSFLLAAISRRDKNHERAKAALREMAGERIIPAPVLPELFYMLAKYEHYGAAVHTFDILRSGQFQIENLTSEDMARMSQIMTQYQASGFDFADTAIMTLSERLNITQIYTLDQRDFQIFRPRHISRLEIFP